MSRSARKVLTYVGDGEKRFALCRKDITHARLLSGTEGWRLRVVHEGGGSDLAGADALRVASKLLARINHEGGRPRTVKEAVDRLEQSGGSDAIFANVAAAPRQDSSAWVRWNEKRINGRQESPPGTLWSLAVADRLALEMATHEETERHALEGELAALEAAWREAEEIAQIADTLALPPRVEAALARLRGGGGRNAGA